MRSFRTPLLVGAVALAGSLVFPGIAGAAEGDATANYTAAGNFSVTAADNGDCTATFELENLRAEGVNANWRADYRVDGETPSMNAASPRAAYRPAVASNQEIVDAIDGRYPIALNTVTVDLAEDRVVPTSNTEVTTLAGVKPNADGTHTVDFGVYQGPVAHTDDIYQGLATITVTGCASTGVDLGSLDGLDIFGSLDGLDIFGLLEGLIPGLEG